MDVYDEREKERAAGFDGAMELQLLCQKGRKKIFHWEIDVCESEYLPSMNTLVALIYSFGPERCTHQNQSSFICIYKMSISFALFIPLTKKP